MADPTDDQAYLVKEITDNLEEVRKSLMRAVTHISGLVRLGRATCQEVKTYNIWALGLYNLQVGMLARLREMGEDVPSLPTQPTYFSWRGMSGEQAIAIDCGDAAQSLEGMLAGVFAGPGDNPTYLSLNEIQINTQDPNGLDVAASMVPSWGDIQAKQELKHAGGLGFPILPLIIIGIALFTTAVVVSVISHALEVSSTNKVNSERNRMQAAAYEQYLKSRLDCLSLCTSHGGSVDSCTVQCKNIAPPEIGAPPGSGDKKWGFLQWAGAIAVGGFLLWGAARLYQRKIKHGSFLPSLPEAWQLPD